MIGGASLEGFAFAMIWGVLIGTYSSIFVAAPILLFTEVQREGSQPS
jgi:preprotein translocase subunit SecF